METQWEAHVLLGQKEWNVFLVLSFVHFRGSPIVLINDEIDETVQKRIRHSARVHSGNGHSLHIHAYLQTTRRKKEKHKMS